MLSSGGDLLLSCEYVYVVLSFRYPCIYFFFLMYVYICGRSCGIIAKDIEVSVHRLGSIVTLDRALFRCLFLQTQNGDFPYNHPFRDLSKSNPEPKLASGNAHTLPPPPHARTSCSFSARVPPHAQEQKRAASMLSPPPRESLSIQKPKVTSHSRIRYAFSLLPLPFLSFFL